MYIVHDCSFCFHYLDFCSFQVLCSVSGKSKERKTRFVQSTPDACQGKGQHVNVLGKVERFRRVRFGERIMPLVSIKDWS
jgi:hypothetical protein